MKLQGRHVAGAIAAGLLLAACGRVASLSTPETALGACRSTMAAGGQASTGGQLAVELDRADGSVMVFVSGPDLAVCHTTRMTDGTAGLGATDVAQGRYPAASPAVLSLESGLGVAPAGPTILVGRIPAGTTAVRLTFGDGSREPAAVGNGVWVAWLATPSVPTMVEALDESGGILGQLADPTGITVSSAP